MIGAKFRAILPKQFRAGTIRLYVLTEARKIQNEMLADFERTVQTWEEGPSFQKSSVSIAGGLVQFGVSTDDPIYAIVVRGSKQKVLERSPEKKAFRFPGTYTAKTIPGVIGSRTGGPGEDYIFSRAPAMVVPGTESRNFDVLIEQKWRDHMFERLQRAFDRAAQASGHSMRR